MFQKLKEICRINKNKEKLITNLMLRINSLSDQVSGLKSDLTRFKGHVADDVKYLTDRVDQ